MALRMKTFHSLVNYLYKRFIELSVSQRRSILLGYEAARKSNLILTFRGHYSFSRTYRLLQTKTLLYLQTSRSIYLIAALHSRKNYIFYFIFSIIITETFINYSWFSNYERASFSYLHMVWARFC